MLDNLAVLTLLAFLPILVIGVLLAGFRWSARNAMAVGFLVVVVIAAGVWQMELGAIAASVVEGLGISLDILYIVFGALLLLATLNQSGALSSIRAAFTRVSPDRRVQAVIIAWLFGSFIEGASGFGTPAAIVGPLLLALGFPAMAAVMCGLIIQSTPVTFGALGTPLLVGVRGGLEGTAAETTVTGTVGGLDTYLGEVALWAATVHAVVGLLVPLFMVAMLTKFFGPNRRFSEGLRVWPFALFAAAAMIVPYWLTAWLLGPEFPSLFGGLIGLTVVVFAASKGFLQPDEPWDFGPRSTWEPHWMGTIEPDQAAPRQVIGVARAWTPYLLLALILVATRVIGPLGDVLRGGTGTSWDAIANPTWNDVFGYEGVRAGFSYLWLPGFVFLVTVFVTYVIHRMNAEEIAASWKTAGTQLVKAAPAILIAVPLVRIFINSGTAFNTSDLLSMPLTLAEGAAAATGTAWPAVAPFIGGLGAFAAGSNTISNLMFSLFQFETATLVGADTAIVNANQAVGGAAGNMVTVHNIVAAAATVGLVGREGDLLRKVLIPCLYYLTAAGMIGYVLVWGLGFNVGTIGLVALIALLAGIFVTGMRQPYEPQRQQTVP